MPTNNGKETIYIDIDDEITSIIEKVRGSSEKIVALVLPKRASVLQSIVNMKLLKRTAEAAKKHIVLITSEAGLLPLAGTVGLHVAKTLQSKPEIPPVIGGDDDNEIPDAALDDEPEAEEVTAETAGDRPVGELAGGAAAAAIPTDDAIETLQMDDDGSDESAAADAEQSKTKTPKKNKKLAIPNFNKFRLRLILAVAALIILIIGWLLASIVLPKATITLTTDTSDINSNLTLNLDTAAKTVSTTTSTLPAQSQQVQKNQSQQVATTGKKNTGTAATGNITASVTCTKKPSTIPQGTGFSSGGLVFITQSDLSLNPSGVDSQGNFICTGSVDITAQQAGAAYNLPSGSKFTYGNVSASNGSALSGGTDNIIQIVSQADIDSANSKIAAQDTDAVKSQLQKQLQQAGLYSIVATFNAGTPATTTSSKVGDQATTLTVSQAITYTMFGVKQADLKTLVDNNVKGQIDTNKQSILSEGLDKASFHVNNATDKTAAVAMSTVATAGPDLKADAIKAAVAGKKSGDIQSMLKADPGVTAVNVHFSPFWVSKAPTKASKVTVIFQKAAK